MARLNSKEIVVKVSKLQKDNEEDAILLAPGEVEQLEAIIVEIAGPGIIVEIEEKE
jgi:hypothetical protein